MATLQGELPRPCPPGPERGGDTTQVEAPQGLDSSQRLQPAESIGPGQRTPILEGQVVTGLGDREDHLDSLSRVSAQTQPPHEDRWAGRRREEARATPAAPRQRAKGYAGTK